MSCAALLTTSVFGQAGTGRTVAISKFDTLANALIAQPARTKELIREANRKGANCNLRGQDFTRLRNFARHTGRKKVIEILTRSCGTQVRALTNGTSEPADYGPLIAGTAVAAVGVASHQSGFGWTIFSF